MRVRDLQQFLSKFTEANALGTRQGNAISNAVVMVEQNGFLHKIKRMEVQEHTIIGQPGLRLVLKTLEEKKLHMDDKLIKPY